MRCPLTSRASAMLIIAVAMSVGCGRSSDRPDLGEVTGVVTLDGRPVVGARVGFRPQEGGRMSRGLTDDKGAYVLNYDAERGAKVGLHTVKITTYQSGVSGAPRAEEIPMRYNTQSELVVEVKPGAQTYDFALEDVPGEKKPQPVRLRGEDSD